MEDYVAQDWVRHFPSVWYDLTVDDLNFEIYGDVCDVTWIPLDDYHPVVVRVDESIDHLFDHDRGHDHGHDCIYLRYRNASVCDYRLHYYSNLVCEIHSYQPDVYDLELHDASVEVYVISSGSSQCISILHK